MAELNFNRLSNAGFMSGFERGQEQRREQENQLAEQQLNLGQESRRHFDHRRRAPTVGGFGFRDRLGVRLALIVRDDRLHFARGNPGWVTVGISLLCNLLLRHDSFRPAALPLVGLAKFRQDAQVFQGARVAFALGAGGYVFQQAAHDFAAAGFGEGVGEADYVRPRKAADLARDGVAEFFLEGVAGLLAADQGDEAGEGLAL